MNEKGLHNEIWGIWEIFDDSSDFNSSLVVMILGVVDEYVENIKKPTETTPVDVTWMLTPYSTIQQAIKVAGIASVKFNREVSFTFNGVEMELEHFNHVDEIDGWLIDSVANIYKEKLFELYSTLK